MSRRWPEQLGRQALAVEQRLLRGDHVEVARRAALVARGRELEHATRARDRDARLRVGALERRQPVMPSSTSCIAVSTTRR